MSALALVLGFLGAGWGAVADRIAARWPEHPSEEVGAAAPIDNSPGDGPAADKAAGDGAAVDTMPEGVAGHPAGWERPRDWRTLVVVVVGALALAGVGQAFAGSASQPIFAAWAAVLVLLLATDLDHDSCPTS